MYARITRHVAMVRKAPTLLVLLLLAACGGGSSGIGGGTPAPPTNASPGGIWTGSDTLTGNKQVVGIVTEDGTFHFIATGPVQYVGQLKMSGNSGSGTFDGYTQFGATFVDGSSHGTGTVSGTVQERVSMSATTQFKTDAGTSSTDTFSLRFNAVYNRSSSLTTLAGNFTSTTAGIVFSVTSAGVIFAQDPVTGCVLNGTASIINASYNVYKVTLSYSNCRGQSATLNGGQLSGVGLLDNTGSPEQFIVAVSGTVGGTKVAVVDVQNRT